MKQKITSLLFSCVFLLACSQQSEILTVAGKLPSALKECSGITYDARTKTLWALNDSGNSNEIFAIDSTGVVQRKVRTTGAENIDWEDITSDAEGNLYIGDFGNNDNDRQDLTIYKLDQNLKLAEKLTFFYPQQKQFPPAKKERLYDCEAFFMWNNHFYLFTKNRSKGFDGTTFIYKIPAVAGHHSATKIGEFKTCSQYRMCAITAAALSPNQQTVALLSGGKVWLMENFKDDDFVSGTITEISLQHNSQKESITFTDNETIFIADEKTKKIGGNLYKTSIDRLKNAN